VVSDFAGRVKDIMSENDFNVAVGRAMTNGDTALDDVPEAARKYVNQSAARWRKDIYEPMFERAKQSGLIDEDVDIKNAVSYLNIIYDVDKILMDQAGFRSILENYFDSIRADVIATKSTLNDEFLKLESTAGDLAKEIMENEKKIAEIEEKLIPATEGAPVLWAYFFRMI